MPSRARWPWAERFGRAPQRTKRATALAAAALLVAVVALGVALGTDGGHGAVASTASLRTSPAGGAKPGGRPAARHHPGASGTEAGHGPITRASAAGAGTTGSRAATGSTPTASSSTPVTPGAPVLSSVSPASGAAGQPVTLSGSGFYSPSGIITVRFGGATAPVRCPSQSTCTATAPDGPAPGTTVPVTVTAGGATSNATPFVFQ